MRPQLDLDQVQQRDDVPGPRLLPGRLAVEEEVEELEAYRVALDVEPVCRGRGFWLAGCGFPPGRMAGRSAGGDGSLPRAYLFSRSWIPVTLRCA